MVLIFLALLVRSQAECTHELMSVGDVNVTSEVQLKELQSSEEIFLLAVTAPWCKHCCYLEPILESMASVLEGLTPRAKILRIDMAKHPFIKRYMKQSDTLPQLYAGRKSKLHHYNEEYTVDKILGFLDRVLLPIRELKTEAELGAFMEVPEDNENFLKTIAFMFDDDEDVYEQYEKTAKTVASWHKTTMAVVKDKPLIKKARDQKIISFLNSLVLLKRDADPKELDLAVDNQIEKWVVSNGIGLVEHLTVFNFQIYSSLRLPMLILFLDPQNIHHHDLLKMFRKVARNFEESVKFVWMDGTLPENRDRKRKIGLVTEVLPSIAFNLNDGRTIAYDEGKDINQENLHLFVQNFLDDKLEVTANKPDHTPDPKFEVAYKDTPYVKDEDFTDKVLTEGNDVLVLFYSSHNNQESYDFAPYFNKLAFRFKELEFPNVKTYRMDVALESIPKNIRIHHFPAVFLFPAFHKLPPYTQYTGEGKTLPMMFFLEKYADVKFELPELPHLSPDQVEAYYEQKKQLEGESLMKVVEANERRNYDL